MKGKLISFSPKMTNGVHETYSGDKGLMYKFEIELTCEGAENIKGTANSSKQSPSWKVGDEYTYEVKYFGANQQFVNIGGLKPVNGFSGGGKKPNPGFVVQKAFEAAVEVAIKFCSLNKDQYSDKVEADMIGFFFNLIVEVKDENSRWSRISALRLILLKYELLRDKLVIEKASKWFKESVIAAANSMEETVANTLKIDGN